MMDKNIQTPNFYLLPGTHAIGNLRVLLHAKPTNLSPTKVNTPKDIFNPFPIRGAPTYICNNGIWDRITNHNLHTDRYAKAGLSLLCYLSIHSWWLLYG